MTAGTPNGSDGLLNHVIRLHLQLVLHVNRRRRNEGMDTSALGRPDGLRGAVNVLIQCPGKTANGRFLDRLCNRLYRLEVTLAGDRKTRLYDVNPQLLENPGYPQFLRFCHRCAGALLTVTQCCVKNNQVIVRRHGALHQGN